MLFGGRNQAQNGWFVLRTLLPSDNYTYLQQGNTQVRVNPSTGRTDRLTTDGWMPISYDRSPESLDRWQIPPPTLTDGAWNNASLDNGEIGFVVENDTQYTVQDVSILLTFDPKPAEASEQTIMAIAGHVSPKMLAITLTFG